MPRLVLLGDSILDNAPYVTPEPDTAGRLGELLGSAWTVELLAVDGATTAEVEIQLRRLDGDVDHAILSVGGNDSIAHIEMLGRSASSFAEVLHELTRLQSWFADRYDPVVRAVQARAARLSLCTIYEPPLADPHLAKLARIPLTVFNDCILRTAARRGLDVVDLRTYCTSEDDFVFEIEPSPQGAQKIAEAISDVVAAAPCASAGRVFAR
ncbi:MAG: SGNH/GDSL hydrolase family protein [Gemmatimonadota bacterium]|nr:SGNH/GDSL hydrolase family protein [Gemmatimonadota bacterium]